jgi:hypothetical protein
MTLTRSIICTGYFFNALICFFLRGRSKEATTGNHDFLSRKLCLCMAIMFIVMVIIRLFDIDFKIIDAARNFFKTNNWYDQRYAIQVLSVSAVGATGIIFYFLMESTKVSTQDRSIIRTIVLLAAYIIINAISYHPIDGMLTWQLGKYPLGSLLEFGLVYLIGVSLLLRFFYPATDKGQLSKTSTVRYI